MEIRIIYQIMLMVKILLILYTCISVKDVPSSAITSFLLIFFTEGVCYENA